MNTYELVYIIQPDLDEENVNTLNERVAEFVRSAGGEVTETHFWGRRTLAYQIGKRREGIYMIHRLQLPPSATASLERNLRLNENVLRHLLTRREA